MYPILFKSGNIVASTQAVLLLIACVAGLWLSLRYADRLAVSREVVLDVTVWGFLIAILGARLLFVLLYGSYYALHPTEILTMEGGGLSFHGGLIASGLFGLYLIRKRGLDPWKVGDVLAPGLALALPIMRVGCFMNGCDLGVATTVPWGIQINGVSRHPIQLYEAGLNLLLLSLLAKLFPYQPISRTKADLNLPSGFVFLIYLFLSSLIRFNVDFFRPVEEKLSVGLTAPQLISLGIMAISLTYLLSYRMFRKSLRPIIKKDAATTL
jgi:phosphatidylglycerol:prolipoprotein diacylglycerol transferase